MTRTWATVCAVAVGTGLLGIDGGLRPAAAQQAGGEEAAVREVLERVFEGMREADSTKVRSAFAEGARFSMLSGDGDAAEIAYAPIDGWLSAIADSERRWDERLYDVVIHVDGSVASAWAPYTFYLDGAVRHCGVDSVELLRTGSAWKITQLADTRREGDCPDPLAGG